MAAHDVASDDEMKRLMVTFGETYTVEPETVGGSDEVNAYTVSKGDRHYMVSKAMVRDVFDLEVVCRIIREKLEAI